MGKREITMDPVQEWGEEVEDGVVYGVTLHREMEQPPGETMQDPAAMGFVQYRTCKVRRLKAATLGRLVKRVLELLGQEPEYAHIFLSTYRTFTNSTQLIQLLLNSERDAVTADDCDGGRSPLLSFLHTWLEEYSEDLREPPGHPSLKLLCQRLRANARLSAVAEQAETLLHSFQSDGVQSCRHTPLDTLQPEEEEDTGEESPGEVMDITDAPVQAIAEQLTLLDAELFVRVVPFQCLGCVWSQRNKKDNPSPTIRATIAQFNAVANRVITSLLGREVPQSPPSCRTVPGASQRARLVEKWIRVAQECKQLRNFSSVKAILSALQSNSVYRLRKTWAGVCKESLATFESLCETFPDENCVLRNKEFLGESINTASVPYLGTYLTVLTMLDTALADVTEDGLINFEKRRREFEVLSQIRQLQASCSHYRLSRDVCVSRWLQTPRLLSEQESYEMSRELEPPVDSCPGSPLPWGLLSKKLSSLLPSSEGAVTKSQDQISVSSSSSNETDDTSPPQSVYSSCQGMTEVFTYPSTGSITPSSSSSISQWDLSPPSSGPATPDPSARSASQHHKRSVSMTSLPVYNRQGEDTCIVRVSVESSNNGNVYKSILLTSQDKTTHVIQRALEKHNLKGACCQDFTLSQVLPQDKELLIPDRANVFYAMSTSANYDFVLRHQQQQGQPRRPLGSSSSFRLLRRNQNNT